MSNVKDKLTDQLEQIASYCHDSVKGYKDAAEAIRESNSSTAAQWSARAEQRSLFASQVSERLRCLGEDGEDSGTIKGAIHRGILKLRESVSGNDVQATISECLRGENELLEQIEEVQQEVKSDGETSRLLAELHLHVAMSIQDLKAVKD